MARLVKLTAFTLVATAACLALAEITLQSVSEDTETVVSPLVYQRYSGTSYTPGPEPGTRVYVSGRRRIVTNKKAGKRILVFGASAAYGEMYSPFTAFSGVAERLLREANPDTPVEILNLAHGGMGSRQVGEMVYRAIENDEPDLIVVYTGNNEYHELRALKARSPNYDPATELLRRRLSKSALYRTLREQLVPSDTTTLSPPEGETWLPIGRLDVTVDDNDRELGVTLYKEHLQAIAVAAKSKGIPLILSTVASNLRDHVDRGTPGQASEAENNALAELRGIAGRIPKSDFATKAASRSTAIQTEAGLHQLGQMYLNAQLAELAADAFQRKELAALRPMTSNQRLRDVVLNAPKQWESSTCDLAGALAESADDGIPGNAQFIDHCHPNAAGHSTLGFALATCIADLGIEGINQPIRSTSLSQPNPFRTDHYAGHRPIPGFKSNPTLPDGSTIEGLAQQGHQAFVQERYSDALVAYTRAANQPNAPAELQLSIGLTHLHLQNLSEARSALKVAVESGVEDAQRVLETLSL